ncbi:unnamed protein product [Owenia fusiformis]|uniref:AAA+ ATPase domain-containing protein n=1 Tax=Owenia fusiformis TaxID=6347 RepID=A0A8S4ND48_OWEFU|nr:unnamed protein product [Owenia fusiformis]
MLHVAWWKLRINKHSLDLPVQDVKQRRSKLIVTRMYLGQTILRIIIEFAFIITQSSIYGFHIPSEYTCQLEERVVLNVAVHYKCDVLKAKEKASFLIVVLVCTVLALVVHVCDLIRTVLKISKGEEKSLFPALREEEYIKPVWVRPPDPVDEVFECENVSKLQEKLESQNLIALTGPPGSGKTQLALHYVREFSKRNNNSICFTFNSVSPDSIIVDGKLFLSQFKLNIEILDNGHLVETAKGLLRSIAEELMQYSNIVNVFLFEDATFETASLVRDVFNDNQSFIVIITSNARLFDNENLKMEVNGYTADDVMNLAMSDRYKDRFTDDDMLRLAEKLDFSPLGIHAGCEYIISIEGTINDYIALLNSFTFPTVSDLEEEIVHNRGYKKTLLQLVMESYCELSRVCKDDIIVYMLNIVATLGSDPIPFGLLDWIIREKEGPLHSHIMDQKKIHLVELVKRFHLGTMVTDSNKHKMIKLHNLARVAIVISWPEEDKKKLFHDMLLILDDQFDKDMRNMHDFQFILELLPHVNNALYGELLPKAMLYDIRIRVLQIRLLDVLNHLHTQTGLTKIFKEENYSKAKQQFYSLINNNVDPVLAEPRLNQQVEEILTAESQRWENITCEEFVKTKARIVYESVTKIDVPEDLVVNLVCTRRLNNDDIKVLQMRMDDRGHPNVFIPDGHLTIEWYDKLVENDAAVSVESIKKVFLLEFMLTILYTHGRMYFYQKNQDEVDEDAKQVFEHDLRLAFELGNIIKEKIGIQITTLLLAERNGILYFDLDSGKRQKMEYAMLRYKALLADESDYFERGILKMVPAKDPYHRINCLRQLVQYCQLVADMETKAHRKQEKYKEGRKEAKELLKIINGRAYHNKAISYITIGDLEMTQVEFGTRHLNDAIGMYHQALELEEKKLPQHSRNMLKALYGLTRAMFLRCDSKNEDWVKAKDYAMRLIEICEERNIKTDLKGQAQNLLNDMQVGAFEADSRV